MLASISWECLDELTFIFVDGGSNVALFRISFFRVVSGISKRAYGSAGRCGQAGRRRSRRTLVLAVGGSPVLSQSQGG